MYSALITDLDGTAVAISSDGSDVNTLTKNAVKSAIKQGKKITCATGREWELAKSVVESLGIVSPCIVEGGTKIVDPKTGETIWKKELNENSPTKILKIFKSESKGGLIMHSLNTNRQKITDVESVPTILSFIYLLAVDEAIAKRITNQVNATSFAAAHFTPSWEGGGLMDIHVTHPSATKEHAIKVWQKLEGVSKQETIGMGDSGNDVPIFQSSGLKIAVGNATFELKESADYIAPKFNEDALRYVINTILLSY